MSHYYKNPSAIEGTIVPTTARTPPEFFARNGLDGRGVEECFRVMRRRYGEGCRIEEVEGQGGCSFTCLVSSCSSPAPRFLHDGVAGGDGVGDDRVVPVVVQFRLPQHAISWSAAMEARAVHGSLAPSPLWVEELVVGRKGGNGKGVDMQVFAMTVIPGVGFGTIMPQSKRLRVCHFRRLDRLLQGMAEFWARGWKKGRFGETMNMRRMEGRIGMSIVERLFVLEKGLPTLRLRREAGALRQDVEMGRLDVLPTVFTHGDMLPNNIIVDPGTWELQGVVDWAEAEHLPFGMALYGVDHLLGYFENGRVIYFLQAVSLRKMFWNTLTKEIPELRRQCVYEAVLKARLIGIFLWHGIAWDSGKLDRAVSRHHDVEEYAFLEACLGAEHFMHLSKL